jgi:hypothetical protein
MAVSTPNLYPVRLTAEQRASFLEITRNGHAPVKKVRHAQILLWSDVENEGGRVSSREIAERLDMHDNTVDRIRKRFVLEGEGPALNRKVREIPATMPKIDGKVEAHLVAICCGPVPEGRVRWTLTLLADELRKKGLVTSVCAETVRKTLKKMSCNPGASNAGASRIGIKHGLLPKWKTSLTSTPANTRRKSH